jgi:hypothetical protein
MVLAPNLLQLVQSVQVPRAENIHKAVPSVPAAALETPTPPPADLGKAVVIDTFTLVTREQLRSKAAAAAVPPPTTEAAKKLGAELKDIVEANEHAAPLQQFGNDEDQQTRQKEHYGTEAFSVPDLDKPDRFGFGKDPNEEDPITQLNDRAGFGFNPQRDLRVDPQDAASKPAAGQKPSKSDSKAAGDSRDAMIAYLQMQLTLAQLDAQQREIERLNQKAMDAVKAELDKLKNPDKAKNPNPDAPDNSSGGPLDPLINNLGSSRRIQPPYVDPTGEEQFGSSGVMKQRGQAVDPNPDADPNEGAARKAILSTSDAVTDPVPDLGAMLRTLSNLWMSTLRG